jgi:hypothetical protein
VGALIPLLNVAGFGLGPPELWPMGIGAGRPVAMEWADGPAGRFTFAWDGDRLAQVDVSLRADGHVSSRYTYRWAADGTLARIELDDQAADDRELDGPDGEPDQLRTWTWEAGRPVRVRTTTPDGRTEIAVQDWAWSADGRTAQLTEQSRHGVLSVKTVTYDAGGRLVRLEVRKTADGPVQRSLEVDWSDDGRLLAARERGGAAPPVREVSLTWSGDRLVEQTSDVYGAKGRWTYRYP